MHYKIWVFIEPDGTNEFYKWREKMPPKQVAKMDDRITKLSQSGLQLLPLILAPVKNSGLYKLKVHGNPQLRPLLTRGPLDNNSEFTLLQGAREISSQFDPLNAVDLANAKKDRLLLDDSLRTEYKI
jgi:hypothetical protein